VNSISRHRLKSAILHIADTRQPLLCPAWPRDGRSTLRRRKYPTEPPSSRSAIAQAARGAGDVGWPARGCCGLDRLHAAFAHAKRPLKFTTPEVAAVCSDLKIINIYEPPVVMDQRPDLAPRARFENVCASTMLALASYSGAVIGWTPSSDEPGELLSTESLP
jgi:hypothetical protein